MAICPDIKFEELGIFKSKILELAEAFDFCNLKISLRFRQFNFRQLNILVSELCKYDLRFRQILVSHRYPDLAILESLKYLHLPEDAQSSDILEMLSDDFKLIVSCHSVDKASELIKKGYTPLLAPVFEVNGKSTPIGLEKVSNSFKGSEKELILLGGFGLREAFQAGKLGFNISSIRLWQDADSVRELASFFNSQSFQ